MGKQPGPHMGKGWGEPGDSDVLSDLEITWGRRAVGDIAAPGSASPTPTPVP